MINQIFKKESPFEIEFKLEDKDSTGFLWVGDLIKGDMIITAKEDVKLESLGFRLILEIEIESSEMQICSKLNEEVYYSHILVEDRKFLEGNQYTFPIEFVNEEHETFRGENINQRVRISPFWSVDKKDKTLWPYLIEITKEAFISYEDDGTKYLNFVNRVRSHRIQRRV